MPEGHSVSDLESFLEQGTELLDSVLDAVVPRAGEGAGELAEAMRHIVFSGGKRLRPNLALLGSLDVGGTREDALGAAAGVELIHAYSLLHDDLPCMDDGQLRRGKPCAHVVFGEATALLAGDALLTLAFEALADRTPQGRPVGAMVVALGRAAGWVGMVGGQMADLAAEGRSPDVERVTAIHAGKTAALISVSLELGALAGGGAPDQVSRLAAGGRELGLAFQIVDDLLDLECTTEELGKQAGADAERGKMTWPAAVGFEQARADAARLMAEAEAHFDSGACRALLVGLCRRLLPRRS